MSTANVCQRYLGHSLREKAAETYRLSLGLLFDFCSGFAAKRRDRRRHARERASKQGNVGRRAKWISVAGNANRRDAEEGW